MKSYQLTYLISPRLNEEELKKIEEKLNSAIKEEGGILKNSQILGRKKLTSKIKKEEEAIFVNLDFDLNPEKIENLKKKINSESKILRSVIILKKGKERKVKVPRVKKIKKEKVELSKIEEKLKEILNES
jgi:small subunit ribosomal protein S6